eukprot:6487470-Alexandrium_andersonii.AAC.1
MLILRAFCSSAGYGNKTEVTRAGSHAELQKHQHPPKRSRATNAPRQLGKRARRRPSRAQARAASRTRPPADANPALMRDTAEQSPTLGPMKAECRSGGQSQQGTAMPTPRVA